MKMQDFDEHFERARIKRIRREQKRRIMEMKKTVELLEEVEKKIGYRFINVDLLVQAFKRSSYSAQFGGEDNEFLEYIGDSVLSMYVIEIFVKRFGYMKSQSDYYDEKNDNDEFCIVGHKNEAYFTVLKEKIVSNRTLANRIDELDLFKYMYLGDTDLDNSNFNKNLTKVKADLFEAILGAIAIDSDWNQDVLQNEVESMLQIDDFLGDVNTEEERPDKLQEDYAINTLKELAEHGKCSVPHYDQPEEMVQIDDGRMMWKCTCIIRSRSIERTAYAISKKEAKKQAAYLVLCAYYGIPVESDDNDDE